MNAHATCLTAAGTGAIAVVALTGNDAAAAAARLCRVQAPFVAGEHLPKRVSVYSAQGGQVDDALLVPVAANYLELHLHGGSAVVRAVLEELDTIGVHCVSGADNQLEFFAAALPHAPAAAGTLLKEVVAAMIVAPTPFAVRLLGNQLSCGLAAWVSHWRQALQHGPESVAAFRAAAAQLEKRSHVLRHFLVPPRIVLTGPPNAGKSSLLNALAGRDASITSSISGTTRDYVEATVLCTSGTAQLAATMVDTAGVRQTADQLEQAAIAHAAAQKAGADLLLWVLDSTAALPADFLGNLIAAAHAGGKKSIVVLNKSDLQPVQQPVFHLPTVPVSARTHEGMQLLHAAILEALGLSAAADTEAFAFSPRHCALAARAAQAVSADEGLQLLRQFDGDDGIPATGGNDG